MTEAEQRAAVTAEARTWVGTPYHDCAMIKGVGVDCAMILKAVYEGAGAVPLVEIAPYSPQWYLHQGEERYLNTISLYADEIEQEQAKPADIAVFRFGRCFAHGAIIIEPGWPHIIHAYKQARAVTIGVGTLGYLADRNRKFFRLKAWG